MRRKIDYREISDWTCLKIPQNMPSRLRDAAAFATDLNWKVELTPETFDYNSVSERGPHRLPSLDEMTVELRDRWEQKIFEKSGLETSEAREQFLDRVVSSRQVPANRISIWRLPEDSYVREGAVEETANLRLYQLRESDKVDGFFYARQNNLKYYGQILRWLGHQRLEFLESKRDSAVGNLSE